MPRYTTIRDLAADLADQMGLDRQEVENAISQHREMVGRYDAVTAREMAALSRAVYADVTGSADYPWAREDAERIAAEDTAEEED